MLNQINLETLTFGPTGGRSVHGCRTARGRDIILQDNVDVRVRNHVDQGDCEASGVTANGAPRDGLRALAGVPQGTLDGARDGDAHGGDDEQ